MKRRTLALMLALVTLTLTACGGGGADAAMTDQMAPSAEAPKESAGMEFVYYASDSAASDGSVGKTDNPLYRDPNAKLIREADLRIQTTEFDQASRHLEELVLELGGYFQSASLDGGSYRDVNANRRGEYVVRVPAEQYEDFLGRSGDLGYVTYRGETTENIGEQYYDAEARLKTQKTKQERLLELLSKAENMEDIISLENALSDVEYEIERLSSTLNRYDNLVGFSTIRLTLAEVHKVEQQTGVADSLLQRMSKGFASSLDGLVEGVQDGLVWVSYHVFGLLMLGVIAAGGGMLAARKFRKKGKKTGDDPLT